MFGTYGLVQRSLLYGETMSQFLISEVTKSNSRAGVVRCRPPVRVRIPPAKAVVQFGAVKSAEKEQPLYFAPIHHIKEQKMMLLNLLRKAFWVIACAVGLHQYRFMPWDWHKLNGSGDLVCKHCYTERPSWYRRLQLWSRN